MSFKYPNRCKLRGSITATYQFNTEKGTLFGFHFCFFPTENEPEHQLMLYTRDENIGKDFPYPTELKPIRVSVKVSSEGIGFELLEMQILAKDLRQELPKPHYL